MIPCVRLCEYPRQDERERSAFARGPKERPLHLVLDVESFAPTDGAASWIRDFGVNPSLDIDEIKLDRITISGEDGTIDSENDGRQRRGFIRHVAHNIMCIEGHGEALDRQAHPLLDKRLALAMYVRGERCDGMVTAVPEVRRLAARFYPDSNPMTPADALALIGLHLRLREDYVLYERSGFRYTGPGIDFYTTLAHGILPDLARWLEHGPPPHQDDFAAQGLATGLMLRMARALRLRDRVHGYALREPTITNGDEMLSYFDGFLVALVGVFDIAARVTNSVYSLGSPRHASWREAGWRSRLVAAESSMGALLADATATRDVIDIIYSLRHTIHAEPLPALGMAKTTGNVTEYRAVLPADIRSAASATVSRLGGAGVWGFEDLGAGMVSVRPTAFVEAAVPAAARALTSLMQAVRFDSDDSLDDAASEVGELEALLPRVRMLGGLGAPGDEQALLVLPPPVDEIIAWPPHET